MSDEIDGLKARQSALEDQLLDLMEAIEPIEERLGAGAAEQAEPRRAARRRPGGPDRRRGRRRRRAGRGRGRPGRRRPRPSPRPCSPATNGCGPSSAASPSPPSTAPGAPGATSCSPPSSWSGCAAADPDVIVECEQCGRILVREDLGVASDSLDSDGAAGAPAAAARRRPTEMLLWFWGTAFLTVWVVFHDPSIDYRVLLARRHPARRDRRPVRRRRRGPLGHVQRRRARRGHAGHDRPTGPGAGVGWSLPIGMFLHLVFDGTLGDAKVFWWPFSGATPGDQPLPSVDRGP